MIVNCVYVVCIELLCKSLEFLFMILLKIFTYEFAWILIYDSEWSVISEFVCVYVISNVYTNCYIMYVIPSYPRRDKRK